MLAPAFYRNQTTFEIASTETCIPFNLAAIDNNNNLAPLYETITFNPPTGVDIYFTQVDCEGAGTALATGMAGPITTEYWLRNTIATTPITNILSSCVTSGVTCQNKNLEVVAPGPFNHFHVDKMGGPYVSGDCMKFKIGAYDNSKPHSYPVTFNNASLPTFTMNAFQAGTMTAFNGSFFTNFNCAYGGTATLSVPTTAQDTEVFFQYQPHSVGGLDINIDVGGDFLQSLYSNIL